MGKKEKFHFMFDNGDTFPIHNGKKKACQLYKFSDSNIKRKHIFISGDIYYKRIVYKYVDRRKVLRYIKDENIFTLKFSEPSSWWDPYEKRFYNADYKCFINNPAFMHRKVLALCVASEKESEPSWRMYADEKDTNDRVTCIQYKLDFKALLDFLNYYIENELEGKYKLVVGSVRYETKKEINKMHKIGPKGKFCSTYFQDFNFRNYINLLRLKRTAFKYESEIRLFLIPLDNCIPPDGLTIEIPNVCPKSISQNKRWNKIITQVSLDPKSDMYELNKYKNLFNGKLGLSDRDVVHSDLLSDINPITIGEKLKK